MFSDPSNSQNNRKALQSQKVGACLALSNRNRRVP